MNRMEEHIMKQEKSQESCSILYLFLQPHCCAPSRYFLKKLVCNISVLVLF